MACPDGQYFCHDRDKCMPIPKGHKVRKDGELVKEAVKGEDTQTRKDAAAERRAGKYKLLTKKTGDSYAKWAMRKHPKQMDEVAPPGWGHTKAEKEKTDPSKPKSKIGGTAAAFKRALDRGDFKGLPGSKTKKEKTSDMFKIMWAMKNKGDKPHYKPGTDKKYKKYQEEQVLHETMSGKDAKKLAKASVLSTSDDPKDQDRARARQVEVDYKDLLRQLKAKKKKKYNESFEIDPAGHKKVQKKAKIRNLARDNKNPHEKAAAEKRLGPKLYGEASFSDWKKKATDAVKRVAGKKTIKKHEYPGRDAGKEARKALSKRDHETVNFLDPDD